MYKLEEKDLSIFIQSLSNKTSNAFLRHLKSSSKKGVLDQYRLFQSISRNSSFSKDQFLEKHKISNKRYSQLKFDLFQELLAYSKENYAPYSDADLYNKLVEFELLLDRGLYIKAIRKFKAIKNIALEKCNFSVYCIAQKKVIEHRLFRKMSPQRTLEEESNDLKHFRSLSDNLDYYTVLSDEVLNLHYEFMDKRVNNRENILKYLEHPLLKDISKARCVMAKYYYYRIKSLIYLGDNNYVESRRFSLKSLNHLESNSSKYRDDYLHQLICINNYLDSSLHITDTGDFKAMYAKMIGINEKLSKKNHLDSNARAFQLLCTLKLNYFWITRDTVSFLEDFRDFEKSFQKYYFILRPNFKLEIILGFAKMHFLRGDLEKADAFCKKLEDEKTNPTALYIICINLLRIMVNIDMGNYSMIPHLVNTSKYVLKKRDRLFDLERLFLNDIHKVKSYHSEREKVAIYVSLHEKISVLLNTTGDMIVDNKIRLLEWLSLKAEIA